jgi:hypothetical protein
MVCNTFPALTYKDTYVTEKIFAMVSYGVDQ